MTPAGQDRLGQAGFLHSGDLLVDDDGRFEIFVGPERRGHNWLQTRPESLIAVRQFFLDRDNEVPISVRIECLDHDDLPSPLSAEQLGRAVESAAAFVAGCSTVFTGWVDDLGAKARNALTLEAGPMQGAWGDPNQIFRHGTYDLNDGEACGLLRILRADFPSIRRVSLLRIACCQSRNLKAARISATNGSGCSKAAKWPPTSGSFQYLMSV